MKTGRIILVLAAAVLVTASLTGCLKQAQPQALFKSTQTEKVVPFSVSFDGTLSYVPNGRIASYLWTFGDGSSESGPLVEHTYEEDGVYEARLTIIDEAGASTSSSTMIKALNPPPTAGFGYSPRSNMEGDFFVSCNETITFEAESYCDDDGTVVGYDWYFGYRLPNGTAAEASGATVTHKFLYAGTYTIILTVTDNDGGTTQYKEQLEVKGGPPCNADITGDVDWTGEGGTCK